MMTEAATTSQVYLRSVSLADYFQKLTEGVDMETRKVALVLKSGSTYFIADILEEWQDAVRIMPEGRDMQPMLVFKDCIEMLKIMDRPVPKKRERDE